MLCYYVANLVLQYCFILSRCVVVSALVFYGQEAFQNETLMQSITYCQRTKQSLPPTQILFAHHGDKRTTAHRTRKTNAQMTHIQVKNWALVLVMSLKDTPVKHTQTCT